MNYAPGHIIEELPQATIYECGCVASISKFQRPMMGLCDVHNAAPELIAALRVIRHAPLYLASGKRFHGRGQPDYAISLAAARRIAGNALSLIGEADT